MSILLRMSTVLSVAVGAMLLPGLLLRAQTPDRKETRPGWADRFLGFKRDHSGGWLFAASKKDGKDAVYFAISRDGYHWKPVNDGRPMLKPSQRGEGMRDPFVQRAPDGSFRMVWTWSTSTPGVIGYSASSNLVFWNEQRALPVMAGMAAAMDARAPAIYYEAETKGWLILWSSPTMEAGSMAAGKSGIAANDRIYATETRDFKRFAPARLFFEPGFGVTDATLLPPSGKQRDYSLLFTAEGAGPASRRLAIAAAPEIEGPWKSSGAPIAEAGAQAPAAIPVTGGYLVYYERSGAEGRYGAAFSADLEHWTDATANISLPEGMRHGSLLHLETSEYNLLLDYHGTFDSGVRK